MLEIQGTLGREEVIYAYAEPLTFNAVLHFNSYALTQWLLKRR